jgi:hypothetical protein
MWADHVEVSKAGLKKWVRLIQHLMLAVQSGQRAGVAEERDDFFNGVCVALSCVTAQDSGTLWREIVRTVGEDDLLQYAAHVEPEEWKLAGFEHYAKVELGKGKPRKRAKVGRQSGWKKVSVHHLKKWLAAFDEELAAYDIHPPIHHLAESAKQIREILGAAAPMPQPSTAPTFRCENVFVKSLSDGNVMVTMLAKAFEPAPHYDVQPVNPAAVRTAPADTGECRSAHCECEPGKCGSGRIDKRGESNV